MVDVYFRYSIAQSYRIAKVPEADPVQPRMNARYRLTVFQAKQPSFKVFGFMNFKHIFHPML